MEVQQVQQPVKSPRRFSIASFLRPSSHSSTPLPPTSEPAHPVAAAAAAAAAAPTCSSPVLLSPPGSFEFDALNYQDSPIFLAPHQATDHLLPLFGGGAEPDTDLRRSSDPGMQELARLAAGLRRDSVAELLSCSAPVVIRRSSMPTSSADVEAHVASSSTTSAKAPAKVKGSGVFQRRKSKEKDKASTMPEKTKKVKKEKNKKLVVVPEITIERTAPVVVTVLTSSSQPASASPRERRGSMIAPSPPAATMMKKMKKMTMDAADGAVVEPTRHKRSRSLSAIPEVAEEMQRRSSSRELEAVAEVSTTTTTTTQPPLLLVGEVVLLPVGDGMPERQRRRHLVINEIVTTERDYVRDLQVLLSVFMMPLQSKGIVTAEEGRRLFSNVKTLMAINQALLADLEARVGASQGNNIGECFLLFGDYLRMYAIYCANQKTAYKTLARCTKTNASFREALQQAHDNEQTRLLNLDSYLIKPMQRLCKYPLLLRELISLTDAEHRDFERLTRALDKIHEVVVSVNNSQKLEEEMDAMANVIERLQGTERFDVPLVVPGRKYFQEGILQKMAQDTKCLSALHYFLFSDLLVLTTAPASSKAASARRKSGSTKKVEVQAMLSLLDAQVDLNEPTSAEDCDAKAATPTVEITSGGDEYVVPFVSADHRSHWVLAYRTALDSAASLADC